jgi:hypothetical protein
MGIDTQEEPGRRAWEADDTAARRREIGTKAHSTGTLIEPSAKFMRWFAQARVRGFSLMGVWLNPGDSGPLGTIRNPLDPDGPHLWIDQVRQADGNFDIQFVAADGARHEDVLAALGLTQRDCFVSSDYLVSGRIIAQAGLIDDLVQEVDTRAMERFIPSPGRTPTKYATSLVRRMGKTRTLGALGHQLEAAVMGDRSTAPTNEAGEVMDSLDRYADPAADFEDAAVDHIACADLLRRVLSMPGPGEDVRDRVLMALEEDDEATLVEMISRLGTSRELAAWRREVRRGFGVEWGELFAPAPARHPQQQAGKARAKPGTAKARTPRPRVPRASRKQHPVAAA